MNRLKSQFRRETDTPRFSYWETFLLYAIEFGRTARKKSPALSPLSLIPRCEACGNKDDDSDQAECSGHSEIGDKAAAV